jgi:hypothetical protein
VSVAGDVSCGQQEASHLVSSVDSVKLFTLECNSLGYNRRVCDLVTR